MTSSFLGGLTTAITIGGGIKDLFKSPAEQQFETRPPFRGTIVTPAFNFGGGVLTRTGTDAFSSSDFATRLGNVRTGLTGLGTDLAGIRPRIGEGLSRVSSLFGESGLLRGRIGELDKTLSGLLDEVRPGFGRLTLWPA